MRTSATLLGTSPADRLRIDATYAVQGLPGWKPHRGPSARALLAAAAAPLPAAPTSGADSSPLRAAGAGAAATNDANMLAADPRTGLEIRGGADGVAEVRVARPGDDDDGDLMVEGLRPRTVRWKLQIRVWGMRVAFRVAMFVHALQERLLGE